MFAKKAKEHGVGGKAKERSVGGKERGDGKGMPVFVMLSLNNIMTGNTMN